MLKYVMDYARASWTVSGSVQLPLALTCSPHLSYRRRADGRDYLLADVRLERRFHRFIAAADVTNLLNTRYQEVLGVEMPGRWIIASLKFDISLPH